MTEKELKDKVFELIGNEDVAEKMKDVKTEDEMKAIWKEYITDLTDDQYEIVKDMLNQLQSEFEELLTNEAFVQKLDAIKTDEDAFALRKEYGFEEEIEEGELDDDALNNVAGGTTYHCRVCCGATGNGFTTTSQAAFFTHCNFDSKHKKLYKLYGVSNNNRCYHPKSCCW